MPDDRRPALDAGRGGSSDDVDRPGRGARRRARRRQDRRSSPPSANARRSPSATPTSTSKPPPDAPSRTSSSTDGEPAFRALERAAVATALAEHPGILALGGGAPLAEETQALLRRHQTVHLSVSMAQGVRRSGIDHRPLLVGVNPRATYKSAAGRAAADLPRGGPVRGGHRRADGRRGRRAHRRTGCRPDDRAPTPPNCAGHRPGRRRRPPVRRRHRPRPARRAGRRSGRRDRAAIVHPATLAVTAEAVQDALNDAGVTAHLVEVPDAEDAKTLERARLLLERVRSGRSGPAGRRDRARRWLGHRRRRFRRRHLDARRAGGAGAHHAARHGRRRGRRQDRHQHRRRKEHGRRVPRAVPP